MGPSTSRTLVIKIIQLLYIYKITSVLCDSHNQINSTSPPKNAKLTATGSSPITSHAAVFRTPFPKPPITFSPTIDNWNLTKILAKKGVDLRNHSNDCIRISHPSNGDFQSLIQDSSFWVDKSLLVKEIWGNVGKLNVLILAPPKWGKSINLSMLKFYLDIPLDPNGFEIPRQQSASYRYFREGKVTRADGTVDELDGIPLISDYEEHLANHPVIHIDGTKLKMDDPLESFRTMIHETYRRHKSFLNYLIIKQQKANSSALSIALSKDIREFRSFYELPKIRQLNENQLVRSIRNLTTLLFNTYRRKVVILFDDYDHFVQEAYFKPTSARPNENQLQWIWDFFTSLTFEEVNSLQEKAVITGVLRANDESTLKIYKNVRNAFAFGYDDLFPYYGIFQPEYRQMVDKRGIDALVADNATQWYGGYRTLSHPHVQAYATYPIVRFLSTLQIRPDYEHHNSTLADFVNRLFRKPRFQRRLRAFVNSFERDGNHSAALFTIRLGALTQRQYEKVWQLERDEIEYSSIYEDEVYSPMLSIGYVTIYEYLQTSRMLILKIPNRDIYYRFCAANSTSCS